MERELCRLVCAAFFLAFVIGATIIVNNFIATDDEIYEKFDLSLYLSNLVICADNSTVIGCVKNCDCLEINCDYILENHYILDEVILGVEIEAAPKNISLGNCVNISAINYGEYIIVDISWPNLSLAFLFSIFVIIMAVILCVAAGIRMDRRLST